MFNSCHLSFTEIEAARLRASVRASAVARKKEEKKEKGKERVSSSALKVIRRGVPKRKADGKDDRPFKKASVTPREKQPKKLLPPHTSHGASKGLMMVLGPIT